jgi:hypothetical protein
LISQAFIEAKGQHMSVKLTEKQTALLESASRREDSCLVLPPNLKGGAAQKVAAKLIAGGLVKETKAKAGAPMWRRDAESEQFYSLKLSAAGAKAVNLGEAPSGKPASASLTGDLSRFEGFVRSFPSRGGRQQSGAA